MFSLPCSVGSCCMWQLQGCTSMTSLHTLLQSGCICRAAGFNTGTMANKAVSHHLCTLSQKVHFFLLSPLQGDAGPGPGKAVIHNVFCVNADMPLKLTSVLFKLTCNALRSASSTASCSLACCPWNSSSILFLQGRQIAVATHQGPLQSQDSLGILAAV